ncbi:MAG: nucleotidyltransferase family protein [Paramuribaculum sp.]|nr:nucleotidyltransferase family protein [Paramuribaculum sp.]
MKGMIFAAGLGSRLRPLTDTLPKLLIEVDGMPLIEHVICKMKAVGITSIVINVFHLGNQIIDFICDKKSFGINIHISDEKDRLLDTGGGIANNLDLLDGSDPVVIYNGDIFSNFPLEEMIDQHKRSLNDVTLLTSDRKTSRKLVFDKNDRMRGWIQNSGEKIRPEDLDIRDKKAYAFGGVHVMNTSVFNTLKEYSKLRGGVFSITDFYIEYCNQVHIGRYNQENEFYWYDIGKPDVLKKVTGLTITEYMAWYRKRV